MTTKKTTRKPGRPTTKGRGKGKDQAKKSDSPRQLSDPIDSIWKSREREREELLETQRELREMVQESQLRILAMRTKGNLARLKIVNKSFDD